MTVLLFLLIYNLQSHLGLHNIEQLASLRYATGVF